MPTPRSAYGFSKLAGEYYCRAAGDELGLRYDRRPFNAYGPGEMPGDEPGIAHIVPDLIERALAATRPFPIFGSGDQTRTLTHVDDIARGIAAALAAPDAIGEDFNISASEELTVREIAAIVWEACGNDPAELEFGTCPPSRSTCGGAGRRPRRPARCSAGRPRSASARESRRPSSGTRRRAGLSPR